MQTHTGILKWLLAAGAAATLLTGCLGGGDNTPAATTLSGTAATGAPIVGGTIDVRCAGGSAISNSNATDANGAWQVTLSGQTLPCAVRVSGGTVGGAANGTPFHSIAYEIGTVNLTPLTDVVVANLAGGNPANWFNGLNAAALQNVNANTVQAAITNVRNAFGLAALNGINPVTGSFTPAAGNTMDDILEALQDALEAANLTYAELIATAQTQGFATAMQQFAANLNAAYGNTQSGGSGGGGSTSCSDGASTTYSGQAAAPYAHGDTVCFTATSSSLSFSGKTLTNPVAGAASTYSIFTFSDADTGYRYETVLVTATGALHEINLLSNASAFLGQFAPADTSGGSGGSSGGGDTGGGSGGSGGGDTGGAYNLTLSVNVNGIAGANVSIGQVPKPANQTEFCADMTDSSSETSLSNALGGAVGTFTINSCSFNGNVGTVNATLTASVQGFNITTPYTVTYTYSN